MLHLLGRMKQTEKCLFSPTVKIVLRGHLICTSLMTHFCLALHTSCYEWFRSTARLMPCEHLDLKKKMGQPFMCRHCNDSSPDDLMRASKPLTSGSIMDLDNYLRGIVLCWCSYPRRSMPLCCSGIHQKLNCLSMSCILKQRGNCLV